MIPIKRLFPILLISLSCVACKNAKQTSSILDIVSNAQYGDTHACSTWANRYWEVFGHRGEMDFMASTSRITPTTFDSIRQIIENEFGTYEYNKYNFPKERITEDGFYWHLSLPSCDDVYYWSNDSLAIAWSLYEVEDNIGYAYLDIKRFSWKWVSDLENKNPLKDSADVVSVYFRFDTIINDFEVSGILYPSYSNKTGWDQWENGVRLFFYSRVTGKEYVWTDYSEKWHCHKNIFMSQNVHEIVTSEGFNGFKNGDTYIFHYDSSPSIVPNSILLPHAEYQFYDIDFDGEDELLLNYYRGGPQCCAQSELYNITDTAFVLICPKEWDNWFIINEDAVVNPTKKTITKVYYGDMCEWSESCFRFDDEGELYLWYDIDNHLNSTKDSIISDTTFYR